MRRMFAVVRALRGYALPGTCVTAAALSLPVTAGARTAPSHHLPARVPAGLRAAAHAHPQRIFDVIVQSTAAATSADAARAVRDSARSRVVKHSYSVLGSVSASLTGAGLMRLTEQPDVYSVTPNAGVTASGYKNSQSWPSAAHIDSFWTSPKAKSVQAATIAIVDSGIDDSNKQFGDRLLTQVDLTSSSTSSAADGRGHGTFVAGVAAGDGAWDGAAPNADLVSLKVFDDNGEGRTSDVLRAIDWILQNKDRYSIRVANLSLQSSLATSFRYDPLDRAVEKLWSAGVVVVAAAGNYGTDGNPSGVLFSPANDPFVITVGAVEVRGNGGPQQNDVNAPWSAYGYTVDGFAKPELAAPGRYMIEWVPPASTLASERPYAVVKGGMELSGTSFSAPVVSGAAAVLLGLHPDWTPDQVKGALMRSATQLRKADPLSVGVGEVNLQKTLDDRGTPPNPNAGLDKYLVPDPDGGAYPVFDAASWLKVALGNASWNSASWASASWNTASWNSASWNSASWNSDSFTSASWNTASWLKVLVTDNAAGDGRGDG
jgi:serine protease AprX